MSTTVLLHACIYRTRVSIHHHIPWLAVCQSVNWSECLADGEIPINLVASDKGAGTTPANPDRQTIKLSPESRPSPNLDNPSCKVWPTTSNLNQPVPTGVTTWQPVVGLRDLYIKHGRTSKNIMGGTLVARCNGIETLPHLLPIE